MKNTASEVPFHGDVMNAIESLTSEQLKRLGDQGFALAFRMLRHREDALDVVQDSLYRLFRTGTRYQERQGSVQAWFLTIVRNRSLDCRRKQKPIDGGDLFDPAEISEADPIANAQQAELIRRVRDCLGELAEEAREIILLRDFHGLCYAEIGQVLAIPPGTVMSRLHRARTALRQKLETFQQASQSC